MKWLCAAICLLVLAAGPAAAETRSVGYAVWNVTDRDVMVRYMLPDRAAKFIAANGSPEPMSQKVADYVLAHLKVSRGNKECPAIDQGQGVGEINTLALTPGLLRYEIVFQCPAETGRITLSDSMFADRNESHTDFAQVQINGGGYAQHVFSTGAPRWTLPVAGKPSSDSVLRYGALGLSHVFHSVDILYVMLALLLIVRTRRDCEIAFGGLAAGYGAAVVLAAFDLLAPRTDTGQAFNGLFVFVVAAAGIAFSMRDRVRAAWVLGAGTLALAVPAFVLHGAAMALAVAGIAGAATGALLLPRRETARAAFLLIALFLFGLWDGFVLPQDLAVLSLPPAQLAPMLSGFNAGALLADAVLPLCLLALWFLVPMVRRVATAKGLAIDLVGSLFVGCGIFWFLSRIYG